MKKVKIVSDNLRLNKNQRIAAEYDEKHVLVLAGAGTGKTLTIIARAEHLIRKGVDPKRILLLTFTRRAAKEMIDRLYLSIGNAVNAVTAGTFHHFCLLTMRRMPGKFGIKEFTVIDRDDQNALMKLARAGYVKKGEKFPKASQLVNIYSYARNTNMDRLEYLNKYTEFDEETSSNILNVFTEYDKRKQFNRYLDFDDILHRFGKKLHEDPSINKQLRGRYDHILVDETQDTNPLQWIILDGLRDPAKLFCVGDDAQSIYAFRGADFRNVHSFKKRISDSVVLKLEDNYRSTQEILDISNWLLKQSPLKYDKNLKAQRGTGIKPLLIDFNSDLDEAKWIAENLIKRHEAGSLWNDHMILTRTAWGSRSVEAILIEKNIPYIFIGGTSFLQAAHVKDLLCLVRAAASNNDELAWIRYLTLWPRIGDVTASRLTSSMKEMSTMDEALDQLSGKLKKDQQKIVDGPKTIIKYWNEPTKALRAGASFLDSILSEKYDKWDLRKKDFDLLVRLAKRYRNLMRFIETYTLDPITSTAVTRLEIQDVVALITVHSAKGTESPVCYVIRVEPGMYPHIRSVGDEDEEEEERRILYVAMTRAKEELILTRSESQSYIYSYGDAAEAYFLSTVPDKLIEEHYPYEFCFDENGNLGDYSVIRPWNER
jgi:DNA helicase-2/ATP-dependent DNA helicase PcrA